MYGKILKAVRKQAWLTQEEMAWHLHSNQASISKYENDRLQLDVQSFVKWMQVTNAEAVGAALIFGVELTSE